MFLRTSRDGLDTDPLLRQRGGLADVHVLPLELCRIHVCDETFLTLQRKYARYEPSGLITGLSCLLPCELMHNPGPQRNGSAVKAAASFLFPDVNRASEQYWPSRCVQSHTSHFLPYTGPPNSLLFSSHLWSRETQQVM